jgi:hypothetical protein
MQHLTLFRGRAPGIHQVTDGENGVLYEHARPGVTHHLAYFITHQGLITMDGAFCAHWFSAPEAAMFQPGDRVIQKITTMSAQRTATSVRSTAITGEHGRQRLSFP